MNCDPIARYYRFFEYLAFGRALERRRLEYLDRVAGAGRVLILGDGDGRFTAEFLARNPTASIDSVDLSSRMLALAQRRLRARHLAVDRICFHHADALTVELPATYDLIVSHFFLDCFNLEELGLLAARLRPRARPGALWLVSEFALPPAGLPRYAARLFIWTLYRLFRLATGLRVTRLADYASVLERQGFERLHRRAAAGGLLVSELWRLQGS